MRILHVVEATTAGVRRHVSTLASTIDQRRFSGAVACPPVRAQAFGDVGFVADLTRMGVPVYPLPMTRAIHPAADMAALQALVQVLRTEQFDLVHCHSSKAGVLGRIAARTVGIPSVYTPHGLYALSLPASPKRRFFLLLEQLAGRLSARVIAVSPGERDLILRHGIAPAQRVVCIENGIVLPPHEPHADRAALRQALGAGNGPLIGTVARLAAQKNPHRFLAAAAALLRDQPAARFVWCGSGDMQAEAEQAAHALGIAHAVLFLGHREDAHAVLAALDMFWLTSDYEGLPITLLEAMALGVPVVATDVVGTRDVLRGEAGMLVPPEHPAGFAQATQLLQARPDWRAAFTRTAATWVRTRWSAARMVRETEQLYEAVRSAHAPTSGQPHTAAEYASAAAAYQGRTL